MDNQTITRIITKLKNKLGSGKNFAKYIFVGVSSTLLEIFLMWLFIDVFGLPTVIGAAIVVVGLFIAKFYFYVLIKLLKAEFVKYTIIAVIFSLWDIILMWLFVDIIKIPTVISASLVAYSLFIFRFIAFGKGGLIRET